MRICWGRRFGLPLLLLFGSGPLHGWTMSVEFPYANLPRSVWEGELAHLKVMGVTHVSLPPASDAALDDVLRIVRRLGLDADLEGPAPERLLPLTKAHGGPLTEPLANAVRVSATMPRALENERSLLTSATSAIVWTNAFETLIPGYQPGAITLAGNESEGAALIRREAQLANLWGASLAGMTESPGARAAIPVDTIAVHQFIGERISFTAVVNTSSDPWRGDLHAMYPAAQRAIVLPGVTLNPHDVLWLPVDLPLAAGPFCRACDGFATSDHLIYATAELTDMEYENGILAMEFVARAPGEVVLQLSHPPLGPLVAGGRPAEFDWETKTQRARLPIPAGNKTTGRVRVALAIDAPRQTAFFQSASVLMIGETNRLTAEFSPPAVAARSRVRAPSDFVVSHDEVPTPAAPVPPEDKDKPALIAYRIAVPPSALPGDFANLAIEADGAQLSHSQLRLLPPATLTFPDAVSVTLAANSELTVSPATIPVNQKSGREIVVAVHNNAPEIRTFEVSLAVPGLEFSPDKIRVVVGESQTREVTFRMFPTGASAGIHEGSAKLTGAAVLNQPLRFVVLPSTGAVDWSAEGLSFLESPKYRAAFLPNRWLEMTDKESGKDLLPPGGAERPATPQGPPSLDELLKLAAPH